MGGSILRGETDMPLYDFCCDKCIKVYEVFVPLKQLHDEIRCPVCGELLVRLFSAPKLIKVS